MRAGYEEIELAALQLEGAALIDPRSSAPGQATISRLKRAHSVFERAGELGELLGFQSERARALFNDGIAFEQGAQLDRALQQYRRALDIAVSAGDSDLANEIRSNAAFAYESQGATAGAIEMLDQIGSDETGTDRGQKMAESLFEKGRILLDSYHYPEAAEALQQALDLQKNSISGRRWGPTGLALGRAYYGMGSMDLALRILKESIPRTGVSSHTGELARAYGNMAAIHRRRGESERVAHYREAQAELTVTAAQRAGYAFERAVDSLATPAASPEASRALFREARKLAQASANILLEQRSMLYLCDPATWSANQQGCSDEDLDRLLASLRSSGIPLYTVEAMYIKSRVLRRQGRRGAAIENMNRLIDDIGFYRRFLPGVLGGWYWENRNDIFSMYMDMVLQQSLAGSRGPADGRQALLALENLKSIESVDDRDARAATTIEEPGEAGRIRALLAKREREPEETRFSAEMTSLLKAARSSDDRSAERMDQGSLNGMIRQMNRDSALLTYYFSADAVYALVGRSNGVRLLKLPGAREIKEMLNGELSFSGWPDQTQTLDVLGKLMLAPVSGQLPENILLLPSGPLTGFPFGLLRLEGRFLSEGHQLTNLLSLQALERAPGTLLRDQPERVFIAGSPQVRRDLFSYDQDSSAEIRAVADIFVGPGLHIVQGNALKRDEFEDERFEQADLIHLAIPGTVDLSNPGAARLRLSGTIESPGSEWLAPGDIRGRHFNARLVVLSGIRAQGRSASGQAANFDFVSGFLNAGVRAVIVSLWQVEDQLLAQFMTDFYQNLQKNPDVSWALSQTQRNTISRDGAVDLSTWGAFQLYIN
jgi:CHAT domain-containing protein